MSPTKMSASKDICDVVTAFLSGNWSVGLLCSSFTVYPASQVRRKRAIAKLCHA